MLKTDLCSEIIGALVGFIVEVPLGSGYALIKQKAEKRILIMKIRKRAGYLENKYEDKLKQLNRYNRGNFSAWIKKGSTLKRILSFHDHGSGLEQLLYDKECFFQKAFFEAGVEEQNEKRELRQLLDDLFQYIDETIWKTLEEKSVFLYRKCLLEVKQMIERSTEEIKSQIQYKGSFAEYIDRQKVIQKRPYKLDYRSEEIPFVGREMELKELENFCLSEELISWWAVIGNGGSGKSRLAYHYIKENMNNSEWKMLFLPDDFFSQINGGGKYTNWNEWVYGKNLFFVVDYVQKYAEEAAQWIESLDNNTSIARKIRILFLERTIGDSALWYKGVFDRPVLSKLKYEKSFLELKSLDSVLIQFALRYAKDIQKYISEKDAQDALSKLKSIDSDVRILYYIMILEAIFEKKPWREWDQEELIGYIVEREQGFIDNRFAKLDNGSKVIRNYNKILAFCTSTRELPVFDMPEKVPQVVKNDFEEIRNVICRKDDLRAAMLLKNDAVSPVTPDIIGEYMVLYIIDQYLMEQSEKEEFIRNLWVYDPEDFSSFIFRILEDQIDIRNDGKSFSDIINLMVADIIPHGNKYALKYYMTLMWGLTVIQNNVGKINEYLKIMKGIYQEDPDDDGIAVAYANGLYNACCRPEFPYEIEAIHELEDVAKLKSNNEKVQLAYADGLYNLGHKSDFCSRKEVLDKLEKLAGEQRDNDSIQADYVDLLVSCYPYTPSECLKVVEKIDEIVQKHGDNPEIRRVCARCLCDVSRKQYFPEVNKTIGMLEGLVRLHMDEICLQTIYAKGLLGLIGKQIETEVKETIGRLAGLAQAYEENDDIQMMYAEALYNWGKRAVISELIIVVTELEKLVQAYPSKFKVCMQYAEILYTLCKKQELQGMKVTVRKLTEIAQAHPEWEKIQIIYAKGLYLLADRQIIPEIEETIVCLERLAQTNAATIEVQISYAEGLEVLSGRQELPEIMDSISKLEKLTYEYKGYIEIKMAFVEGLYNLSCKQQDPLEMDKTIGKLKKITESCIYNKKMYTKLAKGLYILSCRQEFQEQLDTINDLGNLAGEHRSNEEIQLVYAEALYQLSLNQPADQLPETIEKLDEIIKITGNNPDILVIYGNTLLNFARNPDSKLTQGIIDNAEKAFLRLADRIDIQVLYADVLYNLCNQQKLSEAELTVYKIEMLARRYRENIEVQIKYAHSLDFLIKEQKNMKEAQGSFDKLADVVHNYDDNVEMQTLYAKGLYSLSCKQEMPKMRETIERLEIEAAKHSDNPEILKAYACGLGNLSSKLELPELIEHVDNLRKIANRMPEDYDVREAYARGQYHTMQTQELAELTETIDMLAELYKRNRQKSEIRNMYANALYVLCERYEFQSQYAVHLLKGLAKENPGDAGIQLLYASGLYNLCCKQNFREAEEAVECLGELAKEQPENNEILNLYEKGKDQLQNKTNMIS